MDLQKRKAELIEERKKAVNFIEQYTHKMLNIDGAILLIDEMEKAEEVEPEPQTTKRSK